MKDPRCIREGFESNAYLGLEDRKGRIGKGSRNIHAKALGKIPGSSVQDVTTFPYFGSHNGGG